ncbi:hypothetical protein [Sandaracinus amylolyticus]|uniref:hypothetical protein n=1 Tax=Sandaracinus amylolyticus TaxID=927083 RepID=UPI001F3D2B6D|nr:hypothetical protein [Sandaracinus amylolyticus]UJR86867.1 Hypothetical protein I5071_89680 [Sandaracinus amylolyticus]
MAPLALVWMRRIALGLPLVAGPLVVSGCDGDAPTSGGCGQTTRTFALDERDGGVDATTCLALCDELGATDIPAGGRVSECDVLLVDGGQTLVCTVDRFCRGRPPAGLLAARAEVTSEIGAYLARAAHLERASVPAFLDLARELELHGAPAPMISAARCSAIEEARHARAMDRLASREGAIVAPVERVAGGPRSLRELAIDNAVHGCVGEAHAALVAWAQSRAARDPEVRRAHAEIARDEARHALLSIALDTWARERLPARDRRVLEDVRRDAASALVRDAEVEPSHAMRDVLGMPDATRAVDVARALEETSECV